MNEKKWKIIRNSVDVYKNLPEDKQMFVLGFMQGVLSSQQKEMKKLRIRRGIQNNFNSLV